MKRFIIAIVLLTVWLTSSWAALAPGFFRVHDYVHAVRVAEYWRGWQAGQFPVRWSQNLGYGYGMPLFEFYAPLPYAVGSVLMAAGVPTLWILKMLFAGCSLVTMLGAYRLGRSLFGRAGGVAVATLLTLAPYRALNLFIRGALSEAWGIMAIPWILWAVWEISRSRTFPRWQLSLWLAVLLLSHNLVSLLFVPLLALFSLGILGYQSWSLTSWRARWSHILHMMRRWLPAGVLGVLMAVFYVVPAWVEKDITRVSTITGGYFDYHLHFLYLRQLIKPSWSYGGSNWGPDDGLSFFLGFGQWFGMAVAGVLVLRLFWQRLGSRQSVIKGISAWLQQTWWWWVGVVVLVMAVYMSLLKSTFIWDAVGPLEFIQFPWRWLSIAIVAIALMAGAGVTLLQKTWQRVGYVWLLVLVTILTTVTYFKPEAWLDDPEAFYYTDSIQIQTTMSDVLQDYIPQGVPVPTTPPLAIAQWSAVDGGQLITPEQVLVADPQQKMVRVNSARPQQLVWNVAHFPGWVGEIDGQLTQLQTSSGGLLTMTVPAGEHQVSVRWGASPVRAWSDSISAVAWIIWLGWWTWPLIQSSKALRDRHHD